MHHGPEFTVAHDFLRVFVAPGTMEHAARRYGPSTLVELGDQRAMVASEVAWVVFLHEPGLAEPRDGGTS